MEKLASKLSWILLKKIILKDLELSKSANAEEKGGEDTGGARGKGQHEGSDQMLSNSIDIAHQDFEEQATFSSSMRSGCPDEEAPGEDIDGVGGQNQCQGGDQMHRTNVCHQDLEEQAHLSSSRRSEKVAAQSPVPEEMSQYEKIRADNVVQMKKKKQLCQLKRLMIISPDLFIL